jgi:hypothetical protein
MLHMNPLRNASHVRWQFTTLRHSVSWKECIEKCILQECEGGVRVGQLLGAGIVADRLHGMF